MVRSLTEIVSELNSMICNITRLSEIPYGVKVYITQCTEVLYKDYNEVEITSTPKHLSTYTPFESVIMNNNSIRIFGHNYDETILSFLDMNEEWYFQTSLVTNLSNIPYEFIVECQHLYKRTLHEIQMKWMNT